MTEEQLSRSRRRFEAAGALASSLIFGMLLWDKELPSAGEVTAEEYLLLPAYLLLTSTFYFGAFWSLRRLDPAAAREFNLHWLYASAIGTSGSFTALCIRIWLMERPQELFGFVGAATILLILYLALMLAVMASVISAGALYRLVRKQSGNGGRSAEVRGI
jgi:hypothetical protein